MKNGMPRKVPIGTWIHIMSLLASLVNHFAWKMQYNSILRRVGIVIPVILFSKDKISWKNQQALCFMVWWTNTVRGDVSILKIINEMMMFSQL